MPADKSFPANPGVTCQEFATAALDLDLGYDSPRQQAVREHLRICPHCAALQENWRNLRADLHALGQNTAGAQAPARVEMRLLQDFRTKHKTMKTRHSAVLATWALAAAAVILVAVSWGRWRQQHTRVALVEHTVASTTQHEQPQRTTSSAPGALGETMVALSDSSDFTLLPGTVPSATEDATVVHVQMQRAALGALGLTVNDERAGDWIQVDFLVGDDGLPQAVRLPQTAN